MGTITIQFQGMCTHFPNLNFENVPYRIVLVNASNGPTLDGVAIPPHFAMISWPTPNPAFTLPLTGVTVQVSNPTQRSTPGPLPLQSLTGMMAPIQTLGPFSEEVVTQGIPAWTSCHFDINAGALTLVSGPNNTTAAQLVVETDGDPILSFNPFPNAPPLPEGLSPLTAIPSGTTITISNMAAGAQEQPSSPFPNSHFLIHYLTARRYPSVPQVPPLPVLLQETVGGGCSNSSYP